MAIPTLQDLTMLALGLFPGLWLGWQAHKKYRQALRKAARKS